MKNFKYFILLFYVALISKSCFSQDKTLQSKKKVEQAENLMKNYLNHDSIAYKQESLKALTYLNEAIELDSLNNQAYRDKVTVLQQLQNDDDLIVTLLKLLKIEPDFAEGFTLLGLTYESKENYDSSKWAFTKAKTTYLKKPTTDLRNFNLIILEYLLTKSRSDALSKLNQFPIQNIELQNSIKFQISEFEKQKRQ